LQENLARQGFCKLRIQRASPLLPAKAAVPAKSPNNIRALLQDLS
jgi:hypothetical protein